MSEDAEDRGAAAARLLRMLDERSRKRRRIQAPSIVPEQIAFDLFDAPDGNRSRAIVSKYPPRPMPPSGRRERSNEG